MHSIQSNQLQQHNIRHQNHKSPRMKEDASKHYNYDSATTLATPINHQSHQSYARNRNSHSSPWRQSIPSYVHTVTTTTTTVNYDEDYEYDYLEKTPGSRINRVIFVISSINFLFPYFTGFTFHIIVFLVVNSFQS